MKKNLLALVLVILVSLSAYAQLALNFNGTNQYIKTANIAHSNTLTYEAWVKIPNTASAWSGIITTSTGEGETNWVQFDVNGAGKLRVEINNSISGAFKDGTTTMCDNTWHHVAITYNGTNLISYVDGNIDINWNPGIGVTLTINAPFHLMAERTPTLWTPGSMDNASIWNVVRTQAQIQSDMTTCLVGNEAGLLAYYQFEDGSGSTTVSDKTANHYTGSLINMSPYTTCWVSGAPSACVPANALGFDGSTNYIQGGAGIMPAMTAFTLETWVNPSNTSNGKIFSSGSLEWAIAGGQMQIYCPAFSFNNTLTISTGSWQHIAVTYDGANIKFYLNGVLDNSQAATGTISAISGYKIGKHVSVGCCYLGGSLDEFRIWNTARTQSQIQANMSCDVVQQAALVAYYRFNEGTTNGTNTGITSAIDYSGNNYCGTLVNFALTGSTSNWTNGAIGTCNSIAGIPVTATITLGANPTVCTGATSASLSYSAQTNATNYSIVYSAAAKTAGFVDVTNGVLPASPVSLVVPAAATPATYSANMTVSNVCGATSSVYPITVTISATNTVAGASSAPTLCVNTALTNITHTTSGATGIGAATSLPTGVTAAWASNTITISGTPTASGTFNYTVPLTGGCGSVNATGTITVTPANTAAAASSTPTLCINTVLTNITHATTGATGIGVATSLPAGVTAAWASNTITISGTPTASGTFNYSIPLTGGCGPVNATGTITVNPLPSPTIVAGGPLTFCTGGNVNLSALAGGNALSLNGTNRVNVTGTTYPSSTSAYTMEVWVKPNTISGINGLIGWGNYGTINQTNALRFNGSTSLVNYWWGADLTANGIPNMNDGKWHHIAATYNGTLRTIYVDGIQRAQDSPAAPNVTGTNVTIGETYPAANEYFDGKMDEVRIWNIGRTQAQILSTMNTTVPVNSAGLVAYYKMDEGSGTVANDLTGNGNTGTLVGGATWQVPSTSPVGGALAWSPGGATTSSISSTTTNNYTLTLTDANGCVATSGTTAVSVTPNNTVAVASSAPTLCINTALTNITHITTGATGIGTAISLPGGLTATWASNKITISGTPTASGTFNYTIPLTGGCGSVNATGTIVVTPNNTLALSSAAGTDAQTLCINTALTNITYTTTGATGATVTGLPAGVTASFIANTVKISGTPTASGNITYTVTLTGGCGAASTTGTIHVTPNNTLALSSAIGTDAQTLCINTVLTNITYTTTGATGATVTGLPTGVTASFIANTVKISGTPTASGNITYTVTLTGGCGVVSTTGTINVTPNNTLALSSAIGTDAQTLCINTALTNITYTTTGATGATVTGLPAGVTASFVANTVKISGTPTASGNITYTVTLTGGCGAVSTTGTIKVTPDNTLALSSAIGTDAQTLCINTALTNITYTTTGATGATVTGLPTGVTASFIANTVKISGTPTASGNITYTVTLTGGCGVVSTTGTINVTPNNTLALSSAIGTDAQTLCINTALTNITYTTTGATGATVTGLPTGVTASFIANTVKISGTPTASGNITYTVTLTGGCGVVSTTGTIKVTPDNTLALSSAIGTDAQTLCINTALTNITYTTTGATGATVTGLPTGVTASFVANTVKISGTPTASGNITYTVTLSGGCGVVSTTGTIKVTPNNTIALSSAAATDAQTLCINTALTDITYTSTTASGATFSGLPAGVTGSWFANTATITGTPTASGTASYTVTLTGGCSIVKATGTITVTPDNTIALSSVAGTDAQTLCINTLITDITYATTGATGATVTGLPAGVTASFVASLVKISGTPTASVNTTYTVTLTGGCGTVTTTGTINVTPDNTVALSSASGTDAQTLCINTALTNITYTTTGATGATVTGLPTGVTASFIANTVKISGTPTASGNITYTVTLTGGCGTVTTTGTINVTPDNTVTLSSASGTDAQTLCINTALTDITYTTTGATGATVTGLPAGVTASFVANTVKISGTPTASGNITYTVTLTGGCGTATTTGTINVTPDNTVTLSSASGTDAQTLCINTALTDITYTTTGATGATVTGLPAGVTASFVASLVKISGTPTASVNTTYIVTLTGGCGTVTTTGTINVTPDNTLALSSTSGTDAQTLCINTALTDIMYATTGATGATVTGLPAGVTASFIANTVKISGTPTASGNITYTVTLTGGCGTVTTTGTINVTPDNTVALSSAFGTDAQTLCINTILTNITYTTSGATGATVTGLPAGVTASFVANTVKISGTPTASGNITYTVTLTGGCGTVTTTGTINVTPDNTVTLSSASGTDAQTLCINTALTDITYTTTGATGATVTGLPAGVTASFVASLVKISGTPTASVNTTYIVTLTGGCGTVTTTGTINVTPDNTLALSSTSGTDAQTLCVNTALTNITYATTGATGATVTGLPAGVTASFIANTVKISGTPTASGNITYTVTLSGGCGTVLTTGNINVTPDNTVTMTSNFGTDAQTTCINTPITTITYTTTGATGATFSGLPGGVTGTWAGNIVTISGSPMVSGSFGYSVDLSGGCGLVSAIGTIDVPTLITTSPTTVSTACGTANGSANIHATGGLGVLTYLWSPAPASGSASSTGSLSAGTYTCQITDENFCTVNATVVVNNTNGPVVSISTSSNVLCHGGATGSATVSATGGTGAYNYNWTPVSGSAATISGLTAGTYSCQVTDANGCVGSTSVLITEPGTSISASLSSTTPTSCSYNLDGGAMVTASGGTGAYAYSWSPYGGTGASATNIHYGTYTCTITDANGCNTSVAAVVSVSDIINPVITNMPADQSIYTTTSCQAVATWTLPTATDNCQVSSFISNWTSGQNFPLGLTTVTYMATDSAGNTATASFRVTVLDTSKPVFSNCPTNVIVGACHNTVTYSLPIATDNCTVTTALSAGLASGSVFPTGVTTVTYTSTDASNNSSQCSFTVTVNAAPAATLVLNPTNVCEHTGAYLLTGGSPAGGTYSGNGVKLNMFTADTAGVGTTPITYTYTDGIGCSAVATASMTVDLCTGIAEIVTETQVKIYPNPSNDYVLIQISNLQEHTVFNLYNNLGQVIQSIELQNRETRIQRQGIPNGMYLYRILNSNTPISSGRIIFVD